MIASPFRAVSRKLAATCSVTLIIIHKRIQGCSARVKVWLVRSLEDKAVSGLRRNLYSQTATYAGRVHPPLAR